MEERYDPAHHNREMFAHFGRAYYAANVLEEGLTLAIMQADFMQKEMKKIKRKGIDSFNQAKYEADFDAYMNKKHRLTLAQLITHLNEFGWVSADLKKDLRAATVTRNCLAHSFFRDKAEDILSRSGRDQMIFELSAAHDMFEALDERLDEIIKPLQNSLGIKREEIEKYVSAIVDKYRPEHE